MKKTITILIAFILSISIYAQNTPEKFTYQAVVRNADNTLAISQDVGIRISILKTTSSGTVVYKETQSKTTNANGLLTIKIGEGAVISGTAISSIDWGLDKYYIKTEISLQNNGTYDISSTPTQLLSVPYALHAKTADNATTYTAGNGIDITGNAIAVKPATTNSGLTATTDGLKVKLAATDPGLAFDSNGGLKANSVAYTADTDGSIIVANSKIKVNVGDGLTSNSTDGLKVKADANKGLTVDATNGLQVNVGDGLTSNSTDGLKVKADANKGLTVDATDGLQVNVGDGLTSNSTDGLKVKADANKGLTVDATDGLQVKTGDGLTTTVDGLKVKTDETTGSGLSVATDGLKVKADANKGLTVDATNGLQVNVGDGLTSNSTDGLKVKADANKGLTVDATDGLQVKTGDGLTTTVDGLKVKTDETTGSGLSVAATGLKVKADANKGLTVDATDGLQVKTGDGLTTTVDGLKVKTDETTGSGLSVAATGLKVKADANKGLTVDATDGLQVKTGDGLTTTVDGLKVKTDETTGSGLSVAATGLKVKTGDGLTIDATTGLKVKTDTTKSGLAFDANGLKVKTYKIGDFTQGGIVFWVDKTGQHGLVCAIKDQSLSSGIRWYDGGTTSTPPRTNAFGDGIYSGKMNTVLIIATQGSISNNYAAGLCAEYKVEQNGTTYGDWYLPSIAELQLMYDNKDAINTTATAANNGGEAFSSNYYWSSTEYGNNYYAWFSNFGNSSPGNIKEKIKYLLVRSVRAF